MSCENIREQISEFLDGELSPEQIRTLQSHLDQCDHCRKELRHLKITGKIFGAYLPYLEPPPAIWAGITRAIESPSPSYLDMMFQWWKFAAAAAVFLIIIAFVMTFSFWNGTPAHFSSRALQAEIESYLQQRQHFAVADNPFSEKEFFPAEEPGDNPFSRYLLLKSQNPFEEMK